jgi:hypothetical protein
VPEAGVSARDPPDEDTGEPSKRCEYDRVLYDRGTPVSRGRTHAKWRFVTLLAEAQECDAGGTSASINHLIH